MMAKLKQPVNVIIRLMLSLLVWPKVITLSGFYCAIILLSTNRFKSPDNSQIVFKKYICNRTILLQQRLVHINEVTISLYFLSFHFLVIHCLKNWGLKLKADPTKSILEIPLLNCRVKKHFVASEKQGLEHISFLQDTVKLGYNEQLGTSHFCSL